MEDFKERFFLQKRQRNYELSSKSDISQKYNRVMNEGQYVITLKLKSEKSKLVLKCSALEIQREYSITFTLENLKEKYQYPYLHIHLNHNFSQWYPLLLHHLHNSLRNYYF